MRLAIIAAAGASGTPEPTVGERDAMLVCERLGLEDLGFVVQALDPSVDMAEQLDAVLADYEGQLDDVILYTSSLVAVVDEGECFFCLDPGQPDVGDSLRDVAGALAERAGNACLMVVEARFDDPAADEAMLKTVGAAMTACVAPAKTGIELIVSVRPSGAHPERIPSRFTAAVLETIDVGDGPLDARQAYVKARAAAAPGAWPSALGYAAAARRSLPLRDPAYLSQPRSSVPTAARPPSPAPEPAPAAAQPPAPAPAPATAQPPAPEPAPAAAQPPAPATAPATAQPPAPEPAPAVATVVTLAPAPVTAPTPAAVPEAAPVATPVVTTPVASAMAPAPEAEQAIALTPTAAPAPEPGAVPDARPSSPKGRRSKPRRPAPPSERAVATTVTMPMRTAARPRTDSELPKVVISAKVDTRKKPTLRKIREGEAPVADAPEPTPPPGAAATAEDLRSTAPDTPSAKLIPSAATFEAAMETADRPTRELPLDTLAAGGAADDAELAVDVDSLALPADRPAGPPRPPPARARPVEPGAGDRSLPRPAAAAAPVAVVVDKKPSDWTVGDHIAAGDAELAAGFVDKALAEYKKGLGMLGTIISPERAEIYIRMAELMSKRGKARVAISNFDKALAILPSDQRALGGLMALHAEQANWRAVHAVEDKLLDTIGRDDPRCLRLLLDFGDRWLVRAKDPKRAKERYLAARDGFPREIEPLERLLAIYQQDKALDHVLDTRRRIAALVESPTARARVYFELGEYCMFEAQREDDAIAAFELALDSDPTMLEALEVLATVLAEGQEWGEMERVYAKMINTFKARSDPASRTVLGELYHRQALLYRDHLEDPATALVSLDAEIELEPTVLAVQLLAAELGREIDDPAKELVYLRNAARLEPRRADTYHALFDLGHGHGEPETAFLAASVLSVLEATDERERAVFEEHKVEAVPAHVRPMRPQAWVWLRDKERDPTVDRVMRAVAPAVLRARVLQLDADGKLPALPPSRQDPKGSTLSAVRSLAWGSQFLGVDLPAIYLDEERSQPFAAPFAKHQTTVIGKGALQGRSVGELAFLVGRHLALRIPEHELVVHLGSIDELSVCFHAAVKLVLGTTMATGPLAQVVDALAGALGSQQSDEERAALEVAVKQFAEGEARVNLNHWVSGVERCVTRAGLLLCGDLPTAVAVIRAEGDTAFATVDARIDDLCSFAVSGSHVKLRQELGSGLTGTDALPPLTVRG